MKHATHSDPKVIEPLGRAEAYERAIADTKRRIPELNDPRAWPEGDCFAYLWKDVNGICPRAAECYVSGHCKDTWEAAEKMQMRLVPRSALMRKAAPPAPAAAPPPTAPEPAPAPRRRRGGGRTRPVDRACEHFMHALGDPPVLPHDWHPAQLEEEHKRHGRVLASATPSYTSVLIDGKMCMRVWTNAANRANIELVDELVIPARKILGQVDRIPEGSLKKSRPCKYRVKLLFREADMEEALDKLASAVVRAYHLEDAGG